MEEKYEIFEEGKFNKILNLVEYIDPEAIKYYKLMVSGISKKVIEALSCAESGGYNSKDIKYDILRADDDIRDSVMFTYENFSKNYRIELVVAPFEEFNFIPPEEMGLEDEFTPEDIPYLAFSITYTFSNNNQSLDFEVYVQRFDDEYQVVSIKNINGKYKSQKQEMMSWPELMEFAANEELTEEDLYGEEDFEDEEDDDIIIVSEAEYDRLKKEMKISALVENDDVEIDEDSGEPEVEIEFFVNDDEIDEETDNYEP